MLSSREFRSFLWSTILSLFLKPLGTIPCEPVTINITITLIFRRFFSSLARCKYLPILSFIQQDSWFHLMTCSLINPRSRLLHLKTPTFTSQNPRKFYASYFLGQILVCAYIIYKYSQILISCTIPSRSPFPPSHS